jgi:thioredoxin 1
MLKLNLKNFSEEVELYQGVAVIDLYADWCGPCKMLAPIMEELEAEFTEVKFCKINVDEERALAEMFGVRSIPLIAIVKDNTFVDGIEGLVPKEQIAELLKAYL